MNLELIYQRQYPNEPNWENCENQLFDQCVIAIERFSEENPDRACSFLAFDAAPHEGYVHICLDTPENALAIAERQQERLIETRKLRLAGEEAWKSAYFQLGEPAEVLAYPEGADLFEFGEEYESVDFNDWTDFGYSETYPRAKHPQDDYLTGHALLIFWRVFERLIEEEKFDTLKMASPFRLGYQLHGSKLVTSRILNWNQGGEKYD